LRLLERAPPSPAGFRSRLRFPTYKCRYVHIISLRLSLNGAGVCRRTA
jgi:hypothetical protein